MLTAWVAVAVSQAVQKLTGRLPCIKWPNDLLVDQKKLCGILIEMVNVGGSLRVVAGVGLNVEQREADFVQAGLPDATSLSLIAVPPTQPSRDQALEEILYFLNIYLESLNQGDRQTLETAWVERTELVGQRVMITLTNGVTLTGTLTEMNFEELVLIDFTQSHTITPEMIRSIAKI